jgi:pimeloyl-ACP methyl ester carboxylesterase
MQKLHRGYQGRVFAFNHFTLSEDPNQNVEWFQKQLPPGIRLDADIICHSRGGLVSRALAQRVSSLRVGKLVFVAAPNLGTPLPDPKHMVEFIDRYTSILNLAPPGPVSVVAEILEGVAVLVKVLGSASLKGLDGLAAMNPKGPFLAQLQQSPLKVSQPFAVTSNFEPKGSLRELVKQVVADQIMDRVFAEAANDLVVPTAGVAGIPGFPIPAEKTLRFDSDQGVTHTTYFQHPETSKHLLHWLL